MVLFLGGIMGKGKQFFKLQKRVIRLISNVSRTTTCRELFESWNVLTVPCMYRAYTKEWCGFKSE
jgi:hypothetical protein